jgi:hypothetical protein
MVGSRKSEVRRGAEGAVVVGEDNAGAASEQLRRAWGGFWAGLVTGALPAMMVEAGIRFPAWLLFAPVVVLGGAWWPGRRPVLISFLKGTLVGVVAGFLVGMVLQIIGFFTRWPVDPGFIP